MVDGIDPRLGERRERPGKLHWLGPQSSQRKEKIDKNELAQVNRRLNMDMVA